MSSSWSSHAVIANESLGLEDVLELSRTPQICAGDAHPGVIPAFEAFGEPLHHLASDRASHPDHPRGRHWIGVVDGAGGARVAEPYSRWVGQGEGHVLRSLVVRIVVHGDRDDLAGFARCEDQRPGGCVIVGARARCCRRWSRSRPWWSARSSPAQRHLEVEGDAFGLVHRCVGDRDFRRDLVRSG